jgi:hypothetical protein
MSSKFLETKKDQMTIAYKILHDILFVILIFFFASLLAEGILPGIIANHFSFTRVIVIIFVNIFVIYVLGNYLKISLNPGKKNKKTAFFLLFILTLLIFNSLFKLNVFLNIFILLAVLATGYFVYKAIWEE